MTIPDDDIIKNLNELIGNRKKISLEFVLFSLGKTLNVEPDDALYLRMRVLEVLRKSARFSAVIQNVSMN